MTTVASGGQSLLEDAFSAGRAAAEEACSGLPGGQAHILLLFGAAQYEQSALLSGARAGAGPAQIVGCSGEGVISRGRSEETQNAVSALAIHSDSISGQVLLVEGYAADPTGCARVLAQQIGPEPVVGVLVFPDGLVGDCSSFLDTLRAQVPNAMLAGGTSADAMTFDHTYQYAGDRVASGAVSALVLRGQGELKVAVSHGCRPLGSTRKVTRADGCWVHEIDGRPAWEVFREYLDGDPQDLNADGIVHLCIGTPLEVGGDPKALIIRTPLGLNKENGALYFPGGGLHTGQPIRLTRRDADAIKESARDTARALRGEPGSDAPALVLQFDCAGRGKILFGACAAEEIVLPLQEELGPNVPMGGLSYLRRDRAPGGTSALPQLHGRVVCPL